MCKETLATETEEALSSLLAHSPRPVRARTHARTRTHTHTHKRAMANFGYGGHVPPYLAAPPAYGFQYPGWDVSLRAERAWRQASAPRGPAPAVGQGGARRGPFAGLRTLHWPPGHGRQT